MKNFSMERLNAIWKQHTGADLTKDEAWKMVDLVRMMLENADRNINEWYEKQNTPA